MKKRIIAMALCIAMVVGMLPVAMFAAETDNLKNFTKRRTYAAGTFCDVQENDWFYENVKTVYELGIMQGKGGNTFGTQSKITVAETLAIAARLHSIYYTGKDTFSASDPWYQVYADYCAANNIATANKELYLRPATRAEFAIILSNALPAEVFKEINKVSANAIPDVNILDSWGAAVYKLYRAGIMVGNDSNGTFAPRSEIIKCEVAAIVARMIDATLRKSIQLGKACTVTFNMNGHGTQVEGQTIIEGYTADRPSNPTESKYIFKGWYTQKTGGQQFDFNTPITKSITLYARWELDPSWIATIFDGINGKNGGDVRTYTVSFDANGNGVTNLPATQIVIECECAVEPDEPAKSGGMFAGWYRDKSGILAWDKATPIYSDTTIYASWYDANFSQNNINNDYNMGKVYCERVARVYGSFTNDVGEELNKVNVLITQNGNIIKKLDNQSYSFAFDLPKGNYTLTLICDGYQTYTKNFTVKGSINLGKIVLSLDADRVIASGECGQNVYWKIDGSTLRIYGSGSMTPFTSSDCQPWYQYGSIVTTVIVEEGVTEISPLSFALMRNLERISFGKDVRVIGVYAFQHCTNLNTVTFLGNAPSLNRLGVYYDATLFGIMDLTVYYRYGDDTWTEEYRKENGVNVDWVEIDLVV